MKTKILIATTAIILGSHTWCHGPPNLLPNGLTAYQIPDMTKSIRFERVIPIKRSMKFESLKRLAKEKSERS